MLSRHGTRKRRSTHGATEARSHDDTERRSHDDTELERTSLRAFVIPWRDSVACRATCFRDSVAWLDSICTRLRQDPAGAIRHHCQSIVGGACRRHSALPVDSTSRRRLRLRVRPRRVRTSPAIPREPEAWADGDRAATRPRRRRLAETRPRARRAAGAPRRASGIARPLPRASPIRAPSSSSPASRPGCSAARSSRCSKRSPR